MSHSAKEQARANAKCGGLSTTAAKAPPPVEMTNVWVEVEEDE
jgi:hypothetical protein